MPWTLITNPLKLFADAAHTSNILPGTTKLTSRWLGFDGAILDHLQEHYSVMDDEKLVAGKTGTMTLADNQRRSNSAVIPLISPLEPLLQISQLPCAISVCP